MGTPTVVDAGQYTATELLSRLEEGERLVIRAEVLGAPEELTLRFDGQTYYCDTPTTLHKHDDPEEMMACMRKFGYVSDAS